MIRLRQTGIKLLFEKSVCSVLGINIYERSLTIECLIDILGLVDILGGQFSEINKRPGSNKDQFV